MGRKQDKTYYGSTTACSWGGGPPAYMGQTLCSRCGQSLPMGANFCRRCGSAVSTSARRTTTPMASAPFGVCPPSPTASLYGSTPDVPRAAPKPRPAGKGAARWLFLPIIFSLIAWMCVLRSSNSGFNCPWESGPCATPTPPAMVEPVPPVAPTPPTPPLPAPSSVNSLPGTYIQEAWVDRTTDSAGAPGLMVHALVHGNGVAGLRFVAHFRDAYSPIYSADPRFADPNLEATTAMAVPVSKDVIDVTAFIPLSAVALPAGHLLHLQVVPALFDYGNRAIFIGSPVPFNLTPLAPQVER